MNELLFYLVILLANIIQGITGFAGTILAMPFSIKLVGMDTAVPVLNFLGLLSGVYVFLGNRKSVDWKEVKHIVAFMGPALIAGIVIKRWLSSKPTVLYMTLGTIVLLIAITGLWKMLSGRERQQASAAIDTALLVSSGLVHGMFVCGGPLLIGYLTRRLKEKTAFRATISTIWIFLNGAIFIFQLIGGSWNMELAKVQLISIPFLLAGMFLGGVLYKHMSQRTFMIITYVLLFIAGLSLFFK